MPELWGSHRGATRRSCTLGEAPEERYEVARSWLREHGYESTVAYVHAMAKLVLERDRVAAPRPTPQALDEAQLRACSPRCRPAKE